MDDHYYQLLKDSYQKLKSDLVKNSYFEITSNNLFNEISGKVLTIEDTDLIAGYLKEIFCSDKAEAVSSVGTGKMYKGNFNKFIGDSRTRNKLIQLIELAKEKDLSFKKIKEVDLLDYLNRFPFSSSGKPLAYTHRIYVLLFPDFNTVTIDRLKLNKIGKELGITGADKIHFNNLQFQIREIVNDFIEKEGLQGESTYIKMAISEWMFK